ncbi:MAG: CoA transferase, partial [Dehalococcoidia bacterium]|nr:CoA transferase [Dehalococcoidia bacterium]
MSGTLEHLTVVELAGPRTEWCGKLFAQAGARVVLVEPPGGAETRSYAPWLGERRDRESSLHFWHYNTDKQSIALDLAAEEGREAFLGLLGEADILLDGSERGGLAELGLTREVIEGANARLVHVALTPFGQEGPMAAWKGSDLVHQALGGQMMMNGYDDMPASPPVNGQGNQAGHMAGSWGFIAALAALQTGRGTFIDLSVHDACAGMTENALPQYDYTGKVVTRRTGRHASVAPTPAWQHRA